MIELLRDKNPLYFNLYTWGLPLTENICNLTQKQMEMLCCIEEILFFEGQNESFKLCLLYEPTDKYDQNYLNSYHFNCIIEIGDTGKPLFSRNHFAIPLENNRNIVIKFISDLINRFTSKDIIIYFSNNKNFDSIYRRFRIL